MVFLMQQYRSHAMNHKTNHSRQLLVAAMATISCLSAIAGAGPAPTSSEKARIVSAVKAAVGADASAVEPSPIPGLFQVVVESTGNVYYVDATAKYLFDGHLVDLSRRASLTAERKAQLDKASPLDIKSLRLNDAIEIVRGKRVPGRVLVTIEDPNCGFCKRLHTELEKLEDVTIYTFPVSFLGPASAAKNEAIWCAPDRSAAWAATMKGQPLSAAQACDTSALQRNNALAGTLKVRGTPTIFFPDGSRLPGAVAADVLEKGLVGAQVARR